MRRLGLLGVVAVPLLAGCGAPAGVPQWKDAKPDGAAPGVTGAAPASLAAAGPDAAADRFVAAVRTRLPELAVDRRPEEITEMGGEACAGLAAGRLRTAVAEDLQRYGVAGAQAREVVALAQANLCRA